MKKLFLMLFSIALFTSCSDDDENGDDPILGIWYAVEITNPPIPGLVLSECNQNSNITFNSDFSTYSEFYSEVEGNCEMEDSSESTWSKDNSIYTFTIPFEGIGQLNGTADFQGDTFIFTPIASPDTSIVFEK
ncbi:lipocalin family protein [Salegentibacter sp. JZCK2]|uniref:lipocalin family protein n=1 Tax=Salegentibacter tibetensis TaxID=2873600 RepID=UPI001CCA3655|nr:lipocalin family protein [Salegentibacter tibetensis]MBZ9730489.1 lipocalin family protein [Salegentibacter tibetensis]